MSRTKAPLVIRSGSAAAGRAGKANASRAKKRSDLRIFDTPRIEQASLMQAACDNARDVPLTIAEETGGCEQRAKEILARHTDKDWTLCDTISFAVLDARRVTRAFTFDYHFRQYGRIQVLGLNR